MKLKNNIIKAVWMLVMPVNLLTSCNYLDVIPPAQADFDDTMKDESATLGFLYSCYGYVPRSTPFAVLQYEQSADEIVQPLMWGYSPQQLAWGTVSASTVDASIWNASYNQLGQLHRFENLLGELHPTGVTEEDKVEYRAEAKFLDAYYHFRVLAAYGPCPIVSSLVDPNITNTQIPGRSHFDYCVNYIVNLLDEASKDLPATRPTDELGRATSVIAKSLKARVLLYAASPLWNGSFFKSGWQNTVETEGYGKELVSNKYDPAKWQRALTACQEALAAAKAAGHKLFDLETANKKAERDEIGLPFVPGKESDTEENKLFKERVRIFQYLTNTTEGDGNKEIIWGMRIADDENNGGAYAWYTLPVRLLKKSDGSWHYGGYASHAPTSNAVAHFYTENGKLPEYDSNFPNKSEWYKRFYPGTTSPALANGTMDTEDVKNDIIKLHGNREARFYAWIAFDGCQYQQKISNGEPMWLNFKNSHTNGYSSENARNIAGTGYLTRKFIDPNIKFKSDGNWQWSATRRPLIRMAELYLNLAECYAALGQTKEALDNLNIIRDRAGVPGLKTSDINDKMSLTDWVRNERFVELYFEGHRYYDIRRWCIAPQVLKAGVRYGLNGLPLNPSFEEFNTPTKVDQPFLWNDRQYLLPIQSTELYSDPQLVQAPGY